MTSVLGAFLLNALWCGVNCHEDSRGSCNTMEKSAPINDTIDRIFQNPFVRNGCDPEVPSPFNLMAEAGVQGGPFLSPICAEPR